MHEVDKSYRYWSYERKLTIFTQINENYSYVHMMFVGYKRNLWMLSVSIILLMCTRVDSFNYKYKQHWRNRMENKLRYAFRNCLHFYKSIVAIDMWNRRRKMLLALIEYCSNTQYCSVLQNKITMLFIFHCLTQLIDHFSVVVEIQRNRKKGIFHFRIMST
jgi:hypothetical protein